MLHPQRVFALAQVARCPEAQASPGGLGGRLAPTPQILDYAVSASGGHILLVWTGEPALLALGRRAIPPDTPLRPWTARGLAWFAHDDLHPQCVALSGGQDMAVIVCRSGRIFVCPTHAFWPDTPPELSRDANHREWSSATLSLITKSAQVEERCARPKSVLWWTTQDFQSVAIIGTESGSLITLDLVTGLVIRDIKVWSLPLTQLEVMTDTAMDCSYLFVTSVCGMQWRLLLEQRSTGYIWCSVSSAKAESEATKPSSGGLEYRSRLSGLKQMSAAGLASLRQRLSEGRKLLDRRVSNPSTGNGAVVVAEEASELGGILNISHGRLEPLAAKIGDTRVCVQKSGRDQIEILAGVFPDTAILTFHNSELEVLPQTAFKLPRGTERLLIQDGMIIVSTCSQNGDEDARGFVHVVSSHYAELHLDGGSSPKPDSVFQSFSLDQGELVLAMFQLQDDPSSLAHIPSPNKDKSGEPSSQSNASPEDSSVSSPGSSAGPNPGEFASRVRSKVSQVTQEGQRLFGTSLIITNRGVYTLCLDVDPITTFMDMTIRGGGVDRRADFVARTFGLDTKELYELIADICLVETKFTQAFELYQLGASSLLKFSLKMAASGHLNDFNILGLLPKMNSSPEMSPAERIHLSNLALMACFQQVLTKSTRAEREAFQAEIRVFLEENHWFDECLAVRMATETREWELLSHINQSRGVDYEMIEAIALILLSRGGGKEDREQYRKSVERSLLDMGQSEMNGVISCLLAERAIEAMIVNPELGIKLILVLSIVLPCLTESDLRALYTLCAPSNSGLRPVYLALNGGSPSEFARLLLDLFVSTALMVLKKSGRSLNCDSVPKRYLSESPESAVAPESLSCCSSQRRRQIISAGATHVLLQRRGCAMAWGMTSLGVLGNGASASRFSTPKELGYFRTSKIQVFSVACGRHHSLALTSMGVYAWGSSKHGQLGLGRDILVKQRPTSIRVLADEVIIAVATGHYHSLALDHRGRVWTWGWGVYGQLGTGCIEDEHEPVRIFRRSSQVVCQIATGYAHSLLLTQRGEVWAFGCGLFGQLGLGDNKRRTFPVKIDGFDAPIRLISTRYFHSYAVTEDERILTWGCNPQVLRLEAQQKKRERLQLIREEKEEQKLLKLAEMEREEALERGEEMPKGLKPPSPAAKAIAKEAEPDEMLHLIPGPFHRGSMDGRIVDIACGNQHSLFLTRRGKVYAHGRNMDGQLGLNSRKETKEPTVLSAFREDFICHIACGLDFSLAVSDSGSVFAWGNNSGAQLGKLPLSENPETSSKLVVMKTTKRVIRLPNNLQNSCDIPSPVSGITEGIYSNEMLTIDETGQEVETDALNTAATIASFQKFAPTEVERLLHVTLEAYHTHLNAVKVIKRALVCDNAQAASKLSLLNRNLLQAFDFSLQVIVKRSLAQGDSSATTGEQILHALLFYLRETHAQPTDHVEDTDSETRRQLVERLVACWQDQKLSFVHLESLFLRFADPLLLQTLVLTLFCPSDERETDRGPVMNEDSGPKLVDLFTPEFCLKIGDTFVQEFKESQSENHRKASIAADNWLTSQRHILSHAEESEEQVPEVEDHEPEWMAEKPVEEGEEGMDDEE
eukprot:maker-scaffold1024_size69702-snap-gene-0.11 protein:Tk05381 transcript:maker-scaffold1024_size69702-snap-gene-0.11-mRNA-1 annotation:"PREDICTED: uncharacterized protein LOC103572785"